MLKKLHILLIVSILFIGVFSINTYAAEEYSLDTFKLNNLTPDAIIVFQTESGARTTVAAYTLLGIDPSYLITMYDNNTISFKKSSMNYKYVLWTSSSNQSSWVQGEVTSVSSGGDGVTQTVDGSIVYCSFDLLDKNGDIFFQPAPVAVPILEVIMAMTPTIAEKIVETLKILVPFGVGLLALWIGLKILPMVLYKFL